ncbi:LacI family DNA-binding transcriptional regulator [Marinivivus vitaminiproducens]|uniref:LacI family DNA-binding transcriptional regulator n=1 Tax=Marinivivus vitaminiproducens TaxID=3035935 RepID=UPI0027A32E5B|nr:LacI family DNA-binding transcriptional regulator [Geminicoccaceae bacterium SCSIO 64248]
MNRPIRPTPPPRHRARIKMADIAQMTGLSTATVSRALAGSSRVRPATRAQVEAAALAAGYTVNRVAANLRLQASYAVLVLLPDVSNPFFADVLAGIDQVAHEAGYGILIGHTGNDPAREDHHARQYLTGSVDGLILVNGHLPASLVAAQRSSEPAAPFVAVSERLRDHRVPTVGIDNGLAIATAVEHLVALGHRRIAHAGGPLGNILTEERLRGFQEAIVRAGLDPRHTPVRHGDFAIPAGEAAADRLLAGRRPPTAIVCASDHIAIGAMRAARKRGLAVPRDLSVVGFDDIPFAAAFDPAISTVRQPRFAMGAAAMRLLLDVLAGRTPDPDEIVLPTELVLRATTAPPGD